MSRSKSTESQTSTSRIVRKTTSAPKALRVIEGGKTESATTSSATTAPAAGRSSVKGQHGEFAAACLPHQPELYGVAMRICRDPDNAKDLVQETLMRAMVAWASFEPGSNLRAWLFRILTNSFINGYRKRRRHQRFASERPGDALIALYGRDQDHTDDLEDTLFGDQLSDQVQGALGKLGADYRDVVERADLKGQKYKDIAEELEVPIGTVMSRLFRARRVLETELQDSARDDYGITKRAA
jgi:RNA polymerase sigma-70 factor (ECF subfamily)